MNRTILIVGRVMLWNSERLASVIGRRVESQGDSTTARDPIVFAMKAICSELGIGRTVTLLIHPVKTIAVVWGILRCRLMLPASARQWSDEQLHSVLLHELAHIKRRDTVVQLLPARWTPACGLAMARKSSLEGRRKADLGKNLNRRGVSVTLAGLALATVAGVAVPIAMLRAADEEWNPPKVAHVGSNDSSTWSTSKAGKWPLPGGVAMEVKQELVHGADIMSTAILTWPMDKAGGTARHQIWLAGDLFANRDPWMLAWERGATVLWAMSGEPQSSQDIDEVLPTPKALRQIDFSNPEKIIETSWSYVPDSVPDVIRAEFAKGFLPLTTKPKQTTPSVVTSRAEDVRPVKELMSGAWKSAMGYVEVRITFPARPSGEVNWTMTFKRPQGNATVSESLAPVDTPQDSSVRLIKDYLSIGKGPTKALLGRLKRGIGDTLLLDIHQHVDFPAYQNARGIVLVRDPAPRFKAEAESQAEVLEKPEAPLPKHSVPTPVEGAWGGSLARNGKKTFQVRASPCKNGP